jgi:hypothetical protein
MKRLWTRRFDVDTVLTSDAAARVMWWVACLPWVVVFLAAVFVGVTVIIR